MTRVIRRKWSVIVTAALLTVTTVPSLQAQPQRPRVVAGDGVRAHGYFTAGASGAVFALPGDARIELDPGASVKIFAAAQRLKMPEGYAVPTWSVSVRSGRVHAWVAQPKQAAVLLTVSERFSTVVSRGAGMLLVDEREVTAVNVTGVSHTIVSGRWQALEEGTLRSLEPGDPTPVTQATLSPSSISAGRRLWVSTSQRVAVDSLEWTPVSGAADYTVALRRSGGEEPMHVLTTRELRLPAPLGPLEPGQYSVAVRANDARGVPGRWSQPVPLRVVGVELPAGAYVSSSGGIHLVSGQQVHFTHTDGLELIYTGATRYVPANSRVPLHRGERTLVSFREPGSSDTANAWLEPRALEAEVRLGPAAARWPEDDVEVSIQLQATSRGAPLNLLEPRPKVTVGVDVVDVAWRWEGSHLRGTVPRQAGEGPWVIRVEVEDQFGLPLGRNVLEVARSEPARRVSRPRAR